MHYEVTGAGYVQAEHPEASGANYQSFGDSNVQNCTRLTKMEMPAAEYSSITMSHADENFISGTVHVTVPAWEPDSQNCRRLILIS